jgi:hypothetical protein
MKIIQALITIQIPVLVKFLEKIKMNQGFADGGYYSLHLPTSPHVSPPFFHLVQDLFNEIPKNFQLVVCGYGSCGCIFNNMM